MDIIARAAIDFKNEMQNCNHISDETEAGRMAVYIKNGKAVMKDTRTKKQRRKEAAKKGKHGPSAR